jgi:hypothetical protein
MTHAAAATRTHAKQARTGDRSAPADERRQALGWIAGQLAWESRLDALRDDPVDGAAAEREAEPQDESRVAEAPAA